ncbi:MAG TPA: ABC transporter permease, partial [Ktedonobacterales bacterium]|nr:ABC transporter permease [Ktedonobacterales bacterium]
MIGDITTVMTKEWREYFAFGEGNRRTGLIALFVLLFLMGLFLPYRIGQTMVDSPVAIVLYSFFFPFTLMSNIIADSIAGERERHTLETLLASRLSDRAILLGKLAAAVGYSCAISIGSALIGMVVANLNGDGSFRPYPASTAVGIVLFAVLISLLFAGIGVLISLRASSVRQAQQAMGVALIVFVMLPFLIYYALSGTARQQFLDWLNAANGTAVGLTLLA